MDSDAVDSDGGNTGAPSTPYAAVILAGGTGERLGGADKAALRIGGDTLLVRAVEAVREATQIVVVGQGTTVRPAGGPPITFTREQPPGGGPAAGLLAGRDALSAGVTLLVVLAVDMPGVTAITIARLVAHLSDDLDGVFLAGSDGRRQLAGLMRLPALDDVRPEPGETHGLPMHRLLDPLRLALVPAVDAEGTDVDHWSDLERHKQGLPTIEG